MKDKKVIDSLNEITDSLDKSIPFLDSKIAEFRHISALADSKEKPEIGHTYNDLANMLGVMTEHANIISGLAEFEKANYEAINDLFAIAKQLEDSVIKKEEFKEKLEKIEKNKKSLLSKVPLKLDHLKLNFGIASATFKTKNEKE